VSISAPAGVTAGQAYYISATAAAGGNPLQTVILEQSTDGGATWNEIAATPTASNPTDTVGNPINFDQAGTIALQALAYDTTGLEGTANQTVTVVPAYVPPPVAAPEVDPAPIPVPAPAPAPADPVSPDPPAVDPSLSSGATVAATPPADVSPPAAASPSPTPVPTAVAAATVASTATTSTPTPPRPPGVVLTSDAARTLRSDRHTRTTSFFCGPAAP
jgi:hypothetical protein